MPGSGRVFLHLLLLRDAELDELAGGGDYARTVILELD